MRVQGLGYGGGRCLSWKNHGEGILKVSEEGLVLVIREKTLIGSIRQLSVGLSKIIIHVEVHSSIRLKYIRMWGLDLREWRACHSRQVRLLLVGRDFLKFS